MPPPSGCPVPASQRERQHLQPQRHPRQRPHGHRRRDRGDRRRDQAEAGSSFIEVVELEAGDPQLVAIAELHGEDPDNLVGGCRVRWSGSMAWDKAGEAHEGESVFGLIPTDTLGREGLLLRDRGYAETAPVAGRFAMDERDALLLTTAYETMNSLERFSFAGPNVRLRASTVEGLSNTASFCIETRIEGAAASEFARVRSSPASVSPVLVACT